MLEAYPLCRDSQPTQLAGVHCPWSCTLQSSLAQKWPFTEYDTKNPSHRLANKTGICLLSGYLPNSMDWTTSMQRANKVTDWEVK